ncbi:hypothetical protein UFOVP824_25 [uncultured Caudovirales phage]|uniref:Uncharacterized protein n=1 Tax=uncultured Caudovirales phage TaxID=2100421 RepID=A0A6J5PBV0_9CAUD|nr:hypothetical protein UFOVP824_25 [uncultured Caudovirales phage]
MKRIELTLTDREAWAVVHAMNQALHCAVDAHRTFHGNRKAIACAKKAQAKLADALRTAREETAKESSRGA